MTAKIYPGSPDRLKGPALYRATNKALQDPVERISSLKGPGLMTGRCMSILQLPDELLLAVLQRLPKAQLLLNLPLVCKAFARLLKLSSSCWAEGRFHYLLGVSCSIQGSAFCKWLEPRAAQLDNFLFPVDACVLRDDICITPTLLAILPESLTTLKLQAIGSDLRASQRLKVNASQLTALPHLQHGFQVLQDTAPHLSSLTRLSKLQELSLPLHAPIDKLGLESLGALKSLRTLHLEWRDEDRSSDTNWQPHLAAPAFMPNASLSVLTALTKLSIQGSRVQHLLGLAALPHLQCLQVSQSAKLELAGLSDAIALNSLTLSDLNLADPYSGMLHKLRSMVHLSSVFFNALHDEDGDSHFELTALLELPALQCLDVSKCNEFDWTMEADPSRISKSLTRLQLDIPCFWDLPEVPAIGQLSHLVELMLAFETRDETYIIPSSLSSLLCLQELTIRPHHSWPSTGYTEQSIDITAIASLGPAIEFIWLMGDTELQVSSSLIALAERPNLREIELALCGDCSVSSDGRSWLHCAALLHALLTRPSRGLSAVRVQPDLTTC